MRRLDLLLGTSTVVRNFQRYISTTETIWAKQKDPYVAAAAAVGVKTLSPHLPVPTFLVATPRQRIDPLPLLDAVKRVKEARKRKFEESVDIAVNLGINPRRGDHMVRGTALLPHGTGRAVRVAVFAEDSASVEAATAAGAQIVGGKNLVEQLRESGGSTLNFDRAVATPDMMSSLSSIARILGPRGLMPNPKLGTVTENVAQAVKALKKGKVEFRAEKGGVVHCCVGRRTFEDEALVDNIVALVNALLAARPKALKGTGLAGYFLKATLSTTMGPGIPIQVPNLLAAAEKGKK